MILLDTHAVAWLYAGEIERFPEPARSRLRRDPIAISPMVALELQYLREVERITAAVPHVLASLSALIGLRIEDRPLNEVVGQAYGLSWTRDPFDRMIVAHSIACGRPLLTADQRIRDRHTDTIWD